MENGTNKGVIWLVIAMLIVGGGVYLWQAKENPRPMPNKGTPEETKNIDPALLTEYWQSKDLGFTMWLPAGYTADEQPMGVLVLKDVEEDAEPEPEFQVQVAEGNLDDFQVGKGITILTDEEVIINGMKGRKFVITSDQLPEGTECEFYSFEDRGVVYEFSEYQCDPSPIFEPVLNTFELRWEK